METKEYFEKVMQDFNQHRNGRSLRKYCQEEKTQPKPVWQVSHLRLESPDGGFIDINSNNLAAVTSLLQSLSSPC